MLTIKNLIKYLFSKTYGYTNEVYWYPNKEDPLKVSEMEDSHLLNACKSIEHYAIKWATLNKEINKRGLKALELEKPIMSNKNIVKELLDNYENYINDMFWFDNLH